MKETGTPYSADNKEPAEEIDIDFGLEEKETAYGGLGNHNKLSPEEAAKMKKITGWHTRGSSKKKKY